MAVAQYITMNVATLPYLHNFFSFFHISEIFSFNQPRFHFWSLSVKLKRIDNLISLFEGLTYVIN